MEIQGKKKSFLWKRETIKDHRGARRRMAKKSDRKDGKNEKKKNEEMANAIIQLFFTPNIEY